MYLGSQFEGIVSKGSCGVGSVRHRSSCTQIQVAEKDEALCLEVFLHSVQFGVLT